MLLEMDTYRYRGHSMSDPATYRSKEEVNCKKDQDPIDSLRIAILENKVVGEDEIKKIDDEIKNEVIVEVDPEIIETPTIDAKFIGDYPAMMKFIGKNLNYPQEAIDLQQEGVVFVSFVVEKNGEITNVAAVNKVAPSLEKEAIRLVRSFPTWIPGEVNLQKVRTRVRLPIRFELH
jgi:protein TonB